MGVEKCRMVSIITITVLGIVICPGVNSFLEGYEGCFQENLRDRYIGFSPGNWDDIDVEPEVCKKACVDFGQGYAGLTHGSICFCSENSPTIHGAYVADSNCNMPCAGNATEMCGSLEYVSVYKAPVQTIGFKVVPAAASTVEIGGSLDFNISVVISSDVMKYKMDYNNNAGQTTFNAGGQLSKTFIMPGEQTVTGYAIDNAETVQGKTVSTLVYVDAPVEVVDLQGPPIEATFEEVEFNATVNAGTCIIATLDYQDGDKDVIQVQNTGWQWVGAGVPEHSDPDITDTGTVSKFYLMRQSEFHEDGMLVAWEMYAAVVGDIHVMVLTPDCSGGPGPYCYDTNTCSATCSNGLAVCNNGVYTDFCPAKDRCVNPSDLTQCEAPINRHAAPFMTYTVKWSQTVTLVAGYNNFKLSDPSVEITKGDVLAYFADVGKLSTRATLPGEIADDVHNTIGVAPAVATSVTNNYATLSGRTLIAAVTSKPVQLLFFHTYTVPGLYKPELNVSSCRLSSEVFNSTEIIVQLGINWAWPVNEMFAVVGEPFNFSTIPNTGDAVTYFWTFGDGVEQNTTERWIIYTYQDRGWYNVSLTAQNLLSTKQNFTEVIAEWRIVNLHIINSVAPVNVPHPFGLRMDTGSDFECNWDMGDGNTFTTSVYDTPNGTDFMHTYTQPGTNFAVVVTCTNNVSTDTYSFTQAAQFPIVNLRLKKSGAEKNKKFDIEFCIDEGTNPSFRLYFDGVFHATTYDSVTKCGKTDKKLPKQALGIHNVTIDAWNLFSNFTQDFNFSIESKMEYPKSSAYQYFGQPPQVHHIKQGEEIIFNVTAAGTSIECFFFYKDGTQDYFTPGAMQPWPENHYEARTHRFNTPGVFNVEILLRSPTDSYTITHTIIVYNAVENLTLTSDAPSPYINQQGLVNFCFELLPGGMPPTKAKVDILDFGDGQSMIAEKENFGLCSPFGQAKHETYKHQYLTTGFFNVTANVSNPISWQMYTTTVQVLERVSNMRLYVEPSHAVLNKEVCVAVTMEKGELVRLHWNTNNNYWKCEKPREAINPYQNDTCCTTYTSPGPYVIEVMARNALGDTTMFYTIMAQHGVQDNFIATSSAPALFDVNIGYADIDFNVKFPPFTTFPSNASIYIDFGDGEMTTPVPISESDLLAGGMNWTHRYTTDGDFVAKVIVENLASKVEFPVSAGCYIPIQDLATEVLQTGPNYGDPAVPCQGPSDSPICSVNRPVELDMGKSTGTWNKFFVEAIKEDGSAIQLCNYTSEPIPVNLLYTGTYQINITAWNPVSSQTIQTEVTVVDTVEGMSPTQTDPVTKPGEPKTIGLDFKSTASDLCVYVDWGDGTKSVYSNASSCNCEPDIGQQTDYDKAGPLFVPMDLTNTFDNNGFYEATIKACNAMESETEVVKFTVSNHDCVPPIISIKDHVSLFYKAHKFPRDRSIDVKSSVVLNCKTTLDNSKLWKAYKISSVNGDVEKEVDLSSLKTSHNADLIFPERFLKKGHYKLVIKVTMVSNLFTDGEVFASELEHFIEVTGAGLVAHIIAGGINLITRGHDQIINIDPSYQDLDLAPEDDQQMDYIRLFCRQIDEPWPLTADGALDLSNPSSPYTVDELTGKNPPPDNGGCFRKGPGLVSSFKLSFNTLNWRMNETYEFLLIVGKDNRTANATLKVDIIPGSPPAATIGCLNTGTCIMDPSGGIRVQANFRTAVKAYCTDYCWGELEYKWSIFQLGPADDWIEVQNFDQYCTESRSAAIAIDSSLYEKGFAMSSNLNKYRLKVTIRRPGGREGVAYVLLTVNRPPFNGTCSVFPLSGVSLTTSFTMECNDWLDSIASYQYFAKKSGYDSEINIQNSDSNRAVVKLLNGPEYDDYRLQVFVRIRNKDGAETLVSLNTVKVTPMPAAESQKQIEVILDNPEQSEMTKIIKEGNLQDISQYFIRFASLKDSFSTAMEQSLRLLLPNAKSFLATPYGPASSVSSAQNDVQQLTNPDGSPMTAEEAENYVNEMRNKFAKLVEDGLQAITGQVTVEKVEDIKQATEAATALTNAINQVGRTSQKMTASFLKDSGKKVLDQCDNTPYEEVALVAKSMFACSGNVLEASSLSIEDCISPDCIEAYWSRDYFTNYDADEDEPAHRNKATRQNQKEEFTQWANSEVQKQANVNITRDIFEGLEDAAKCIRKSLVSGQEPLEIRTAKFAGMIRKTKAKFMTGSLARVSEGNSWVEFPPWCDLASDRVNCTEDEEVCLQVFSLPINTFHHVDNGHFVEKFSSSLSVSFFDNVNNEIPISKAKQPLQLYLANDDNLNNEVNHTIVPSPVRPNTETDHLFFHSVDMQAAKLCGNKAFVIELVPEDKTVQILVLIRFGGQFPEINTTKPNYGFDIAKTVPESMANHDPNNPVDDAYKVFIDQINMKNFCGKIVIGLRALEKEEHDTYSNKNPPGTPKSGTGLLDDIPYTLLTYSVGCYHKQDEHKVARQNKKNEWKSDGCTVQKRSDVKGTYCECNHMTTFAGSFAVEPNQIDWDFVFSNADFFSNPTLYITEIILACVYIIVAIWARRQDKKDAMKLGCTPLPDNDPNDKYLYEVLVKTGSKKSAGTDSQVSFIFSGDYDETDVRMFADKERKIFRRDSTDSFLMAVPRPLGPIQYARIWHDNNGVGKYQGWYCSYMVITDLQTKEKYIFLVNKWFAVEEDDGQIDRLIPIAGPEQLVEFGNLVPHTARKNLSDDHLWFSVIARPPQSRFTRLQRVSCVLLLVYTVMLANVMFYERTPDDPASNIFTFGPFALSPQQLYVGFICNLIVFPINFLVVFMFRRSRPRRKKPSRLKQALEAHAKASGGSVHIAQNDNTLWIKFSSRPASRLSRLYKIVSSFKFYFNSQPIANNTIQKQSSSNDMKQLIDSETKQGESSPVPNQSPVPDSHTAPMRPDTGLAQQTMAIPMTTRTSSTPKGKKKKGPFTLPWIFKWFAWFLLWAGVGVSVAFVTFYGISFGDLKCKKWITSLFISFVTSIFLTQPIKVVLTALLFSVIFKKADMNEGDEEEDEEELILEHDEQFLHPMPGDPNYHFLHKERKINYKPPDPAALERARAHRMKELKMYDILREILLYSFFLWILLVISYGFRDPNAYLMKENLGSLFLDTPPTSVTQMIRPYDFTNKLLTDRYIYDFEEINTFDSWWDWLENIAIPALRADRWYNGEPPLGQRGFVGDRVGRIMGPATLRQLRVEPNGCELIKTFNTYISQCNEEYSMSNEVKENFDIGWKPLPKGKTVNDTKEEYVYRTAEELDSYPYWGSEVMYSGGGYVAWLRGNAQSLKTRIAEMKKDMWIDRYTRAIFLEFTIYNPNVNLFGIVTICAEVLNSGGMTQYKRIEPMNLLGYYQDGFGFQIFCEIVYCVFIVFFIIKEGRNMYKQGKMYFKQFWNWMELSIIILSLGAVAIYFYRYMIAKDLVEEFSVSHGNSYMKFQYVGYWNELLLYLCGWLVFCASLKFIKLLRFNKRMGMLASTLRVGAKPLLLFSIMFGIMFMAYAQLFYLVYFMELRNFRTIIHAMETCLQMLVGKFNFTAMRGSSPFLGPLFFFCYVVSVFYILINMFLTILNESFASVRADITLQSNEYEMVSFIMKRFRQWSGIQSLLGNKKPKNQKEAFEQFAAYERQVQQFPERMDRFLEIISRAYFLTDNMDAIFDSSRPQEGKQAMKALIQETEKQQMMRKGKGGIPGMSSKPPLATAYNPRSKQALSTPHCASPDMADVEETNKLDMI